MPNFEELTYYVGILPLLALVVALKRPSRKIYFWLIVMVAGLLLALGSYGFFYKRVYDLIPIFRLSCAPAHAAYMTVFAASVVLGLALNRSDDDTEKVTGALRWWVPGTAVFILLALAAKARNKQQRMRVLEGALAQLTLVWSQLDYRPKLTPDGRLATPELPSFRDATAATKTILTELRNEYDDVPAQQVEVSGPNGRSLPIGMTVTNQFKDLNDDELLDRIRELESRRTGNLPESAPGAGTPGTGTDADPLADSQE